MDGENYHKNDIFQGKAFSVIQTKVKNYMIGRIKGGSAGGAEEEVDVEV